MSMNIRKLLTSIYSMAIFAAVFIWFLLISGIAGATPFAITDPYTKTPPPTHCGFFLNATTAVYLPVAKDASNAPYCKQNLASTPVGTHKLYATHAILDSSGNKTAESGPSNTLTFTVPAAPSSAPTNIRLSGTSIVSDRLPTLSPAITHCVWYVDSAAPVTAVVGKNSAGESICTTPMPASTGSHTAIAAASVVDALWGTKEGPRSSPFVFVVPDTIGEPSALKLVK
jgi:hypothetical protein